MDKKNDIDPADFIGGTLNLLGMKIDIGEMLKSQDQFKERLEELREKLKASGGKETLSDDEWRAGGIAVSGQIRTRGILGDQEFHVGTAGQATGKTRSRTPSEEIIEPPTDVFDEDKQITIVADVPGVSLDDMELKVEGKVFRLSMKKPGRRNYRKEIKLKDEVQAGSLKASCRNGVLEVRLSKISR